MGTYMIGRAVGNCILLQVNSTLLWHLHSVYHRLGIPKCARDVLLDALDHPFSRDEQLKIIFPKGVKLVCVRAFYIAQHKCFGEINKKMLLLSRGGME